MTGARIDVRFDSQAVEAALERLANRTTSARPAMADIGEYLQRAVDDRFRAERDPENRPWAPLQPSTLRRKRNDKILTERGGPGLRGSIHYRADDDRLQQGTNKVYAAIHQFGGSSGMPPGPAAIPARPYLGIGRDDEDEIATILLDHLDGAL